MVALTTMRDQGLPLHPQGKHRNAQIVHHRERITPAPAGRRLWLRLQPLVTKDYPRVCGEKGQ